MYIFRYPVRICRRLIELTLTVQQIATRIVQQKKERQAKTIFVLDFIRFYSMENS